MSSDTSSKTATTSTSANEQRGDRRNSKGPPPAGSSTYQIMLKALVNSPKTQDAPTSSRMVPTTPAVAWVWMAASSALTNSSRAARDAREAAHNGLASRIGGSQQQLHD